MLLSRVLTAVILIPLFLFLIIKSSQQIFMLVSIAIFAGAAWEWANLSFYRLTWQKCLYTLGFLLLLAFAFQLPPQGVLAVGSLFWLIPFFWIMTFKDNPPVLLKKPLHKAMIGYFCLTCACLSLNYLHQLPFGAQWIILLLLLVWATDTFAYFVGRKWGKKPLSERISPKKTQAGFWGGLVGALVTSVLTYVVFQWPLLAAIKPPLMNGSFLAIWLSLALIISLLAVVGDLFESLLKRLAQVKDSGTLLPGHGGILDRLDSLIATLPMYTFVLSFFKGTL